MKAFIVFMLGAAAALPLVADGDSNPPAGEYDKFHRFVFFAVLEGCYEDGLTSEEIDLIVPRNKAGEREITMNFIYSCPLCHPAFEAFRLYGSREPFVGQKVGSYDTFGPGLSDERKEKLRGAAPERRKAIQSLISRWLEMRADLLRLDDDERAQLRLALKEMKKKGDEALQKFQEAGPGDFFGAKYESWKGCPTCEGAVGARMGGLKK